MSRFDVFLSHNSKDKVAVLQLAHSLRSRELSVWLDEWELVPGQPWQDALEVIVETTRAALVLVGKDGLGPWQNVEMRGCLSQFVERRLPVIPVLLPNAASKPDLPLFLRQMTWVDLRMGFHPDGLDLIVWGITGRKPQTQVSTLESQPHSSTYAAGFAPPNSAPTLLTFEKRYRINKTIDSGHFTEIYGATDLVTQDTVVVKVLHGNAAPFLRERFTQEAHILQSIDHHSIPKLLSTGVTADGRPFVVEEFVDGEPLSTILKSRRLSLNASLDVIESISKCLSYVHAKGIVHRDIKPSNVIIPSGDRYTDARLVDFGLARFVNEAEHRPNISGTLSSTMVPEQFRTLGTTPFRPTEDVFALGALLFEMRFGRPPFQSDDSNEQPAIQIANTLSRVARGVVDIPTTPSIGYRTRLLLTRCLNSDPLRRPATAAEVLAFVRRIRKRGDGVSITLRSIIAALLTLVALTILLRALVFPAWPTQLFVSIITAEFGIGFGVVLHYYLLTKATDISHYISNVLSGAQSCDILTRSLAIQLDDLLAQCRTFDAHFLARSIAVLLDEYDSSSHSLDRQAALMNSVTLLDRLTKRATPWYIRHSTVLVGATVGLSLFASAMLVYFT